MKADERPDQQPGRGQQHDCQRDFPGNQQLPEPDAPAADDATAGRRGPESTFPIASAGNTPDRTQVSSESTSVKREDPAIERHGRDRQKMLRQELQQPAERKRPDDDAGRPSQAGEQQVFQPQLSLNLPAGRAECEADGDFTRAAQHPDQAESGDICAGDEQDEACREHQRQHLWSDGVGCGLLQRHGVIGELCARIGARKLLEAGAPAQCAIQLGIGLLPRRAILQPHEGSKICCPSFTVPARLEGGVDVGLEWRAGPLGQDAHDCMRLALQERRSDPRPSVSRHRPLCQNA